MRDTPKVGHDGPRSNRKDGLTHVSEITPKVLADIGVVAEEPPPEWIPKYEAKIRTVDALREAVRLHLEPDDDLDELRLALELVLDIAQGLRNEIGFQEQEGRRQPPAASRRLAVLP